MTELVLVLVAGVFLAWGSLEDWLFGTVGNYIWIFSLISFSIYSFLTGDLQIWIGVLWYFLTGFLVATSTELGGADAWALAVFGAGAWILGPLTGLISIAVSSLIYSVVMDKVLEREIRLIPSFFVAYLLITFLFLFL